MSHEIDDTSLAYQIDETRGLLLIEVHHPFTSEDFELLSEVIEPYFQQHGEFKGLIVNSKKFPYWKGSQNLAEYKNFAANNHFKFQKVALAMDGFFVKIIANLARRFVHPQIKIFGHNQVKKSQQWILS